MFKNSTRKHKNVSGTEWMRSISFSSQNVAIVSYAPATQITTLDSPRRPSEKRLGSRLSPLNQNLFLKKTPSFNSYSQASLRRLCTPVLQRLPCSYTNVDHSCILTGYLIRDFILLRFI